MEQYLRFKTPLPTTTPPPVSPLVELHVPPVIVTLLIVTGLVSTSTTVPLLAAPPLMIVVFRLTPLMVNGVLITKPPS